MPTDPSLIPDQFEETPDELDDPTGGGPTLQTGKGGLVGRGDISTDPRLQRVSGLPPKHGGRSGMPSRRNGGGAVSQEAGGPTDTKDAGEEKDKSTGRAAKIAAASIGAAIAGAAIGAGVSSKRRVMGAVIGAVVVGGLAGGATAIWVA